KSIRAPSLVTSIRGADRSRARTCAAMPMSSTRWCRWRTCSAMSAICAPCRRGAPPSPCNSITTNRCLRPSPPRFRQSSPETSLDAAQLRKVAQEPSHGQTEIRTHEAALQRWDDWSRGPRQDDADGGADEGVGGQGLDAELCELRPGGEGVGKPGAARSDQDFDDCDEPRGIFHGAAPLRARGLPGPCRLRQEHDHGGSANGWRDPGGVGGGWSDA